MRFTAQKAIGRQQNQEQTGRGRGGPLTRRAVGRLAIAATRGSVRGVRIGRVSDVFLCDDVFGGHGRAGPFCLVARGAIGTCPAGSATTIIATLFAVTCRNTRGSTQAGHTFEAIVTGATRGPTSVSATLFAQAIGLARVGALTGHTLFPRVTGATRTAATVVAADLVLAVGETGFLADACTALHALGARAARATTTVVTTLPSGAVQNTALAGNALLWSVAGAARAATQVRAALHFTTRRHTSGACPRNQPAGIRWDHNTLGAAVVPGIIVGVPLIPAARGQRALRLTILYHEPDLGVARQQIVSVTTGDAGQTKRAEVLDADGSYAILQARDARFALAAGSPATIASALFVGAIGHTKHGAGCALTLIDATGCAQGVPGHVTAGRISSADTLLTRAPGASGALLFDAVGGYLLQAEASPERHVATRAVGTTPAAAATEFVATLLVAATTWLAQGGSIATFILSAGPTGSSAAIGAALFVLAVGGADAAVSQVKIELVTEEVGSVDCPIVAVSISHPANLIAVAIAVGVHGGISAGGGFAASHNADATSGASATVSGAAVSDRSAGVALGFTQRLNITSDALPRGGIAPLVGTTRATSAAAPIISTGFVRTVWGARCAVAVVEVQLRAVKIATELQLVTVAVAQPVGLTALVVAVQDVVFLTGLASAIHAGKAIGTRSTGNATLVIPANVGSTFTKLAGALRGAERGLLTCATLESAAVIAALLSAAVADTRLAVATVPLELSAVEMAVVSLKCRRSHHLSRNSWHNGPDSRRSCLYRML